MKFLSCLVTVALLGYTSTLSAQQNQPAPTEPKPAAAPPVAKPPAQKPPAAKPSAPKPQAPKPKPKPKKYVIQSGDNPWTIAKDHGVDHAELLRINKIEDPKNMKIGDVLILPEGVASKNAPKPKEAKPAAPAPGPQSGDGWEMYTIQSGDNPWSIAKKLKLDHQKIISLNEGLDFRDLKIGQQIKIPKKS